MNSAQQSLSFMRGVIKRHGPSSIKKLIWDQEFSEGKWNFIDNTLGDCVYTYLERYAEKGSILDLGCGPGNTATELDANAYQTYVGVDISEAALRKATRRTEESGRANKNRFSQGDFLTYVPTQQFDVILFREALYHVPLGKVKALLDRYANYLKDGGVFIVRIFTLSRVDGRSPYRPKETVRIIETGCEVVENCQYDDSGLTVIVFRPR